MRSSPQNWAPRRWAKAHAAAGGRSLHPAWEAEASIQRDPLRIVMSITPTKSHPIFHGHWVDLASILYPATGPGPDVYPPATNQDGREVRRDRNLLHRPQIGAWLDGVEESASDPRRSVVRPAPYCCGQRASQEVISRLRRTRSAHTIRRRRWRILRWWCVG